jgi:hypothetical protein
VTEADSAPAPPSWNPHVHGDRRRRPTPALSRYSLWGGRRRSAANDTFTDLYGAAVFTVMLGVCALNVLDSFFTLAYLQRGGTEANPIADKMIRTSPAFFVFWKTFILGNALSILCLHKNFRRARVGIVIGASLYVLLTMYHLFLFFRDDIGRAL